MKIHNYIFCIIFCYFCRQCASKDIFFPFGTAEGDSSVTINDDGSSGIIYLSTLFPFFDHIHEFLYVNTNGVISFLREVSQYTPDPFPLGNDRRLVAPFWADVDTNNGGRVYYREVVRHNNEGLADRATNIVRDTFIDQNDFTATWLFIATWDNVSYYGSNNINPRNDFQAILVTNGRHSFTFFHYGDIEWTTGAASDGNPDTGLGGTPAQVGFNAGDGRNFYSVPGSRNASIVDIDTTTNVGVIGRWVFRIDEENVIEDGCHNEVNTGTLTVFPSTGLMLGGNTVLIQGPCFDVENNITCKFIDPDTGPETQGVVLNTLKAECVTPILFQTGRIRLYVSNDGGLTFGFEGVFTLLNIEDVAAPVTVDYTSSPSISVTWDTSFTPHETVNIELFIYAEDWTTLQVTLDRMMITEQVDGTAGIIRFHAEDVPVSSNDHIGIVRVSKWNNQDDLYVQSIWSEVMDLGWLHAAQSPFGDFRGDTWCDDWGKLEDSLGSFLEDMQQCPCTLQQALVDIGRFTPHSACYLPSNFLFGCETFKYVPQCVRANTPSESGSGVECCYGPDGELLNIQDQLYAGFFHRRHNQALTPHGKIGQVPYLSHFAADILPLRYCCYYSYLECENFKDRRPSDDCTSYVPPAIGGGNGDPHIRTLDGTSYTFNGHGEYTFVEALNGQFVMQCRTEPITGRNATRFTAMAAAFDGTDSVHIGLSERRGLDARIKSESGWQLVDFERTQYWTFNGISVYKPDDGEVSIMVIFEVGIAFTIKETNDVMSIIFYGTESMKGTTRGLLGTWNDDKNDDFFTPSGNVISINSTLQEIHYNFGQLWSIDPQDALFYYEPGEAHNDYSNPTFVPLFEIPNNVDADEVKRVCGDNFECMFDYQASGDPEIAQATRTNVENLNNVVASSAPVVACPFVPVPINGTKNGTSNIEGSHLIFTCDPGFDLLGSDDIVCQANGTWSSDAPICQQILCRFIETPVNGKTNGQQQTVCSVLQFSCDEGYEVQGSEEIICQENGEWSGEPPICDESTSLPLIIGLSVLGVFIVIISIVLILYGCSKKNKQKKVYVQPMTDLQDSGKCAVSENANATTEQ
ncbi:sushi domain-containing protein 2-like [Anneissia japonica]|uniref:sushi domain-containing protein 2-like n=1 Tax=Anneissia japonica TaxID=1529436 RepID=UPI00142579B2|nr:sushi domain-containing protein 2-like [Anneissia japonica]